jgi:hypothetical protein
VEGGFVADGEFVVPRRSDNRRAELAKTEAPSPRWWTADCLAGYLLSRGSGPVGSRGIGRVVDWSLGSEPVAGPNRSTARSPTRW